MSSRLPKTWKKDNSSRIYVLTVNDEIVKIGGSQDKGGIERTLSIYKNGGVGGRPSIRSYGVFRLIQDELEKGNRVGIYLIKQKRTKVLIRTLMNEIEKQDVNIGYNEVETECLNEYHQFMKEKYGDNKVFFYPKWNFQEAGLDWPQYIKEEHSALINESLKKGRKK